ncbi:hypothetical protein FCM35_KLT12613 [Carex littledalei]|uniref:Uncharacterized protein n=1 Tax=Carex littledalei TaxID=544730 RepID=A0A833QPB7_9POAL|nr:hypothetical protein FCM35_KLT12613 [Carex littledalei]
MPQTLPTMWNVAFAFQQMKVDQYGTHCHATTGSTQHALILGSKLIRPAQFAREMPIEGHNCTGCKRKFLDNGMEFQDSELQLIYMLASIISLVTLRDEAAGGVSYL